MAVAANERDRGIHHACGSGKQTERKVCARAGGLAGCEDVRPLSLMGSY